MADVCNRLDPVAAIALERKWRGGYSRWVRAYRMSPALPSGLGLPPPPLVSFDRVFPVLCGRP